MMKKILKISAFAAIFTVMTCASAKAQDSGAFTYFSPYSLFGIGVLEKDGGQNSLAMGGMGIADRSVANINLHNPAAVTARESQSFMLDFGISQKNIYYKDSKTGSVNNTFNIHHLAVSFPIYKNSAFKAGIKQYSSTGYSFMTNETDDENLAYLGDIKYTKDGKGGIYQVFLGAGVTFWDKLSVGVDGQYYFGTIDRYSGVYYTTNTTYRTILRGWQFVPRGVGAKFGIQYEQPFSNGMHIIVGGTYKFANKISGENTNYVHGISSSATDTLVNYVATASVNIPSEWGVGFTLKRPNKWTIGLDYTVSDWSTTTFAATPGVDFKTAKSQSINAGFEYIPNKYDIRYYMKRVAYRGGIYYNKTYMSLNNRQIDNTGITLGISFPVFNRGTSLSLGFDFGQMGTLQDNLVRERYFKIYVGLDLFDIWFQKPLYN